MKRRIIWKNRNGMTYFQEMLLAWYGVIGLGYGNVLLVTGQMEHCRRFSAGIDCGMVIEIIWMLRNGTKT